MSSEKEGIRYYILIADQYFNVIPTVFQRLSRDNHISKYSHNNHSRVKFLYSTSVSIVIPIIILTSLTVGVEAGSNSQYIKIINMPYRQGSDLSIPQSNIMTIIMKSKT